MQMSPGPGAVDFTSRNGSTLYKHATGPADMPPEDVGQASRAGWVPVVDARGVPLP